MLYYPSVFRWWVSYADYCINVLLFNQILFWLLDSPAWFRETTFNMMNA